MEGRADGHGLGIVQVCQAVAEDLLGHAGAFAALGADLGGLADFGIAAAAFHDGFTDMAVGYTHTKTDVHGRKPYLVKVKQILMLTRMIVKDSVAAGHTAETSSVQVPRGR